jgi:hypothetical protein
MASVNNVISRQNNDFSVFSRKRSKRSRLLWLRRLSQLQYKKKFSEVFNYHPKLLWGIVTHELQSQQDIKTTVKRTFYVFLF